MCDLTHDVLDIPGVDDPDHSLETESRACGVGRSIFGIRFTKDSDHLEQRNAGGVGRSVDVLHNMTRVLSEGRCDQIDGGHLHAQQADSTPPQRQVDGSAPEALQYLRVGRSTVQVAWRRFRGANL